MAKELSKIMYVEDEPDIREIAQLALEGVGGYSVLLCASGEEALAGIDGFAPDLVLLDVMLPGMDGPAILQAIRDTPAGKEVPVIMLTAKAQSAEIERYKALGAADVITKPFDPIALSDQVRSVWEQAVR